MAKVRIYTLAGELGIESKDILGFLAGKNIEAKTASSSVEEEVASLVKGHFSKGKSQGAPKNNQDKMAQKQESKQESKPKQENGSEASGKPEGKDGPRASEGKAAPRKDGQKPEGKTAPPKEDGQERPKKKSSITAVFNPQNSKMGGGRRPDRGGRRGQGGQNQGRGENRGQGGQNQGRGENRGQNQGRGENRGQGGQNQGRPQVPQRSASERAEAVKAKFDKILSDGKKPAPAPAPKPEPEKAKAPVQRIERIDREQLERAKREQAERAARAERLAQEEREARERGEGREGRAERTERSEGRAERTERSEQGARTERGTRTERSGRNERTERADRNDRRGENRGSRSDRNDRGPRADRNDRGDRNARPSGNRSQGGRGERNEGERNNNRNFQNNRQGGNRPQGDKGGQRFNNNRPKESRSRLEQEITKMNQAAPAEEPRKESRDNRRSGGQKQERDRGNKRQEKKQERYVNLEKNSGKRKKPQPQPVQEKKEEEVIRNLTLPEKLTIKELADKMKVQASVIIKKLFLQGIMATVNQEIEYAQAEEIALEFNCICEMEEKVDVIEELLKEEEEDESTMVKRPPVVCVMGHVDHGKTSLLDAIRDTHVIDREAGGITQHIGAYMVDCNGEKITFLDTPGHEAFTAMRMRGANSTDIAILVVAADDGVMPQTVEAISHAKAAGVEIIVAINKIDKPSANIERVKQELSEYELIPEDWGGSTVFCPVSAHTHEGLDNLLEMILLTAEVLELKANKKRLARGLVIEAQLDKGRGAVATVLVQKGTLKVGQPIAAGSCSGKVRAMIDDQGRRVKEAGPSTPVEILGLNSVPNAGEVFVSTESEKEAKNFADTFISQSKEKLLEDTKAKMSLDDLFSQIQSGNVKELGIIVKADVQGSVEAVKQSLVKLSNEEVVVKVIHGGVGAINESDVSLASASNAIIIGFNVRPDAQAKASAEREGVDLRLYKVIYNAIEDVQAAMKGMLDPIFEEKVIGHAEIRQIFKSSGVGNIAGSYVLDGTFQRGCKVRVSRQGEQLYEGNLASLKRFKDDVKEVKAGYECGLVFEGFSDFEELDIAEAYIMVEVPR